MDNGAPVLAPPWKSCKVFCALVVTVKRSVDEICMHYFHNLSSVSGILGAFPQTPQGLHPWTPLEDLVSRSPNLHTPRKDPASAHVTSCFSCHTPRMQRAVNV